MAHGDGVNVQVRRFRLTVVEGPAAGKQCESSEDRSTIGSQDGNDLQVADPTVSRYHCEIVVEGSRAAVIDLGSKNGTTLDGVHIKHAYLRDGSLLRLGKTVIRFDLAPEINRVLTSERRAFGQLVGASPAMRHVFALLERAAASDATVLLEGETGTGKGEAAEALHRNSARKSGPFVTVDCGAIPANLLESELFGHERGAFTGATAQRVGSFEEANGGTIFLDEIGELPPDLQPKLLRVLETRTLRRVGGTGTVKVDVRIVAATNRDLRAEVNAGRFRADLYFRLAVVRCALPALRQRPEDLPLVSESLLRRLGADDEQLALLAQPGFHERLASAAWPGNVRELRNYLERCLVFQDALPLGAEPALPSAPQRTGDAAMIAEPLTIARDRAALEFERQYLETLLARHDRMIDAAAAAGIGRVYLYKLMVKHGLRRRDS
ncbi:MAG: sigma 54-interacting transcriptional regulator [Kofleriaceae bacterium]|nr:sigma 54-interacting transcriptional regulator [Kofleriaceae bacterium]